MAAGTTPIFILTPKDAAVRIATANTARDGTGTIGTLYTAGVNGSFLKGIRMQSEGTVSAGVIRVFIQSAGVGNNELIKEQLVTSTTPSTTVEAWSAEWFPPAGIVLGASSVLKVSTHVAETFSCHAEGLGDF